MRHNVALVVMLARKQSRGTLRLEELVQEGNLGLLRAIEKFDPSAGTRFSTYAVWWIRAYVVEVPEAGALRGASEERHGRGVRLLARRGRQRGRRRLLPRLPRGRGAGTSRGVRDGGGRRAGPRRARARSGSASASSAGTSSIRGCGRTQPDTLEQIGGRWGVSRERVRQVELQTKRFLHGYLGPMRDAQIGARAA